MMYKLANPKAINSERISLIIALALIVVGITGCVIASMLQNFILLLTFVEITSVPMFFVLLLCLIPAYFPDIVKAGSIFYCGLAKEPYMNDESIYRPNVPLLNSPYDTNWDEYYDKSAVRIERA
ncbi:MAG: hypothetical protein QXO75_08820 [Nitrososphaerota archaeon]